MVRRLVDRRSLVGGVAAGVGSGLAGCLGILGGGSGSGDDRPGHWRQFGADARNRSAVAVGPGPDVERRWMATVPDPEDANFVRRKHSSPVSDGDRVYVHGSRSVIRDDETTETRYVLAVGTDGSVEWITDLEGPGRGNPLSPAVVDAGVLVPMPGSLRVLSPETGQGRSRIDVSPALFSAPTTSDGAAYVGSVTAAKVAIAAGQRRWLFEETGEDGKPLSSVAQGGPAVANGSVYLPLRDTLLAVSTDGTRRFRHAPDVRFPAFGSGKVYPPAVGPDGTIFATIGSFRNLGAGSLVAVAPDGSTRWTFRPDEGGRRHGVYGTPAVAGGTVYVTGVTYGRAGAGERRLYALDTGGSLRWSVRTGVVDLAPVVAGGTVLLAGGPPDEGRLVSVENGGTVRTRTAVDRAGVLYGRSAAVVGDLAIVPTREGLVAYGSA